MAGYGSCHTLFFHVSLTVWLFVHFFYSIYHCHGYTLSINLVARGRASALHIQTSRLEKRNLICLKVNQLRHTLFFVRPPPLIVSFRELYWVKASFERQLEQVVEMVCILCFRDGDVFLLCKGIKVWELPFWNRAIPKIFPQQTCSTIFYSYCCHSFVLIY